MRIVDSCARHGWAPSVYESQLDEERRKALRERVRHLSCREIGAYFCVAMQKQFFWPSQSPYYGKIDIPTSLLSWLDYERPETIQREDCVNVTMIYDDESAPRPRPVFYVTVHFDDFIAQCGDLVTPYVQSFNDERQRIKGGQMPNVM